MIKIRFLTLCMVILSLSLFPSSAEAGCPASTAGFHRIISLSPSITETLYALGLGDRVAGVTRYCSYPPEARLKPKVGGYTDPNYEAILRLHPDLVILVVEHAEARSYLQSMHIAVLQVNHNTVDDILGSITTIGKACGAGVRADSLKGQLLARMGRIKTATRNSPRPGVLVSVGRAMGSLSAICIAGKDTYYGEMVALAGGTNALKTGGIAFPMISPEGICQINPQVIIDMVPQGPGCTVTPQAALSEWKKAGNTDAVRDGRVYVFTQDFAEIPGPRFIAVLEQMAKVIHPELKWK